MRDPSSKRNKKHKHTHTHTHTPLNAHILVSKYHFSLKGTGSLKKCLLPGLLHGKSNMGLEHCIVSK